MASPSAVSASTKASSATVRIVRDLRGLDRHPTEPLELLATLRIPLSPADRFDTLGSLALSRCQRRAAWNSHNLVARCFRDANGAEFDPGDCVNILGDREIVDMVVGPRTSREPHVSQPNDDDLLFRDALPSDVPHGLASVTAERLGGPLARSRGSVNNPGQVAQADSNGPWTQPAFKVGSDLDPKYGIGTRADATRMAHGSIKRTLPEDWKGSARPKKQRTLAWSPVGKVTRPLQRARRDPYDVVSDSDEAPAAKRITPLRSRTLEQHTPAPDAAREKAAPGLRDESLGRECKESRGGVRLTTNNVGTALRRSSSTAPIPKSTREAGPSDGSRVVLSNEFINKMRGLADRKFKNAKQRRACDEIRRESGTSRGHGGPDVRNKNEALHLASGLAEGVPPQKAKEMDYISHPSSSPYSYDARQVPVAVAPKASGEDAPSTAKEIIVIRDSSDEGTVSTRHAGHDVMTSDGKGEEDKEKDDLEPAPQSHAKQRMSATQQSTCTQEASPNREASLDEGSDPGLKKNASQDTHGDRGTYPDKTTVHDDGDTRWKVPQPAGIQKDVSTSSSCPSSVTQVPAKGQKKAMSEVSAKAAAMTAAAEVGEKTPDETMGTKAAVSRGVDIASWWSVDFRKKEGRDGHVGQRLHFKAGSLANCIKKMDAMQAYMAAHPPKPAAKPRTLEHQMEILDAAAGGDDSSSTGTSSGGEEVPSEEEADLES